MFKNIISIFLISLILLFVLCILYLKNKKQQLHIITVVTDTKNQNYLRLVNSANLNKLKLIPLVSKQEIGHGKGFGMKIKMMMDYIHDINNNDIIMFVDGYDVLIVGTESDIIDKYKKFVEKYGNIAIFSAEYYCWPDDNVEEQYIIKNDTPYNYLNSGTYISSVGQLKKIIKIAAENIDDPSFEKFDDQRFFTSVYLKNKNLITLDNYNNIFNCMAGGLDDLELHNKKWFNKKTKTYPLVFHGNGGEESKNFLFKKIYPTI